MLNAQGDARSRWLTPCRVGTVIGSVPAGSASHMVSVELDQGKTLTEGDLICLGIPVPESTDPPLFMVRSLVYGGHKLRSVSGPGVVTCTVRTPMAFQLKAPVCRIISAIS